MGSASLPTPRRRVDARAFAFAVLGHAFPFVAFAFALAAFYPGHLSFDSAVLYWQGRTGEYLNVSPPLLSMLWGSIDAIWPGSGGQFVLHVALFIGGAWTACCAIVATTWKRIAAVVYIFLGTPAFLVVTHLWTDALLIASLTAGCGVVLAADRIRSRAWLFAALPLFAMGGLARHNGVPALVPLLAWWGLVYIRIVTPGRLPRASVLVVGALAGTIGIAGAGRFLENAIVKHRVSTFTAVQVFDIAGISVRVDEMLFPDFMFTPGFTMGSLRARYVPYNNVPLFWGGDGLRETLWEDSINEEQLAALRKAWWNAIVAHPGAYLSHRMAVTSWLFDRYRNDRPRQLAIVESIGSFRGNPLILPNETPLHQFAMAWYDRSIGWWGFAPITYIVIALALLFVNWRARTTQIGQAALAWAASGLAYVAPLPLVVPSAELRYSGWMFAATSLALVATIQRMLAARAARASPVVARGTTSGRL